MKLPLVAVEACYELGLEALVLRYGVAVVAGGVGKDRQRELRRAGAAVAPFESGGAVIP